MSEHDPSNQIKPANAEPRMHPRAPRPSQQRRNQRGRQRRRLTPKGRQSQSPNPMFLRVPRQKRRSIVTPSTGKPRRSSNRSAFPGYGNNVWTWTCLICLMFLCYPSSLTFISRPTNFLFHHRASVPRCKSEQPKIKAKEIEVLWLDSAERKAIMDTLSPSEITRRRYK